MPYMYLDRSMHWACVSIQYFLIFGCDLRKMFFSTTGWSWIWFCYYRDLFHSSEWDLLLHYILHRNNKNLQIIHFLKCDGLFVYPQAAVLERSKVLFWPHIFCLLQKDQNSPCDCHALCGSSDRPTRKLLLGWTEKFYREDWTSK